MGKKKGKDKNKLARMSEEERLRYLQHRAELEEEAKRRKQQLISTFMKVNSNSISKILLKLIFNPYNNTSEVESAKQHMRNLFKVNREWNWMDYSSLKSLN